MPSIRVDQVIADSHSVLHTYPIPRSVESSRQVTVHPHEPDHRSINRIMERPGIERILPLLADKVLIIRIACERERSLDVRRPHIRLSASTQINSPKGIATRDLSRDEEVLFTELASALSDRVRPVTEHIRCDLGGLIDGEAVDIEHCDGYAGEVLDAASHAWFPFS